MGLRAAELAPHAAPAGPRHPTVPSHARAAHGHLPAEPAATGHPPAGHHRTTLRAASATPNRAKALTPRRGTCTLSRCADASRVQLATMTPPPV
jgi:hypothetical protein